MSVLLSLLYKCTVYSGKSKLHLLSYRSLHCAMPKDRSHIPLLKEGRFKFREKKNLYCSGNSNAYLQILGSGAPGAPSSVCFISDFGRYLFNCGEGVQRLSHEHKVKMTKLEHIFITHSSWKNIGGLPGLTLTLQDVGVPDLTIHGPDGIETMFKATNKFVVLYNLLIKSATCKESIVFEDPVMTVKYVPLVKQASKECEDEDEYKNILNEAQKFQDNIDYYAHMRKKTRSPSPEQNKIVNRPELRYAKQSIAFICKMRPKQGSLILENCVEKGVPPGPLLGKLKNGEDITLPNGTVVLSSDVKEPDCPGPAFIVLECPSIDYLDSLVNERAFENHQIGSENSEEIAKAIVHFTPSDIVKHEKYQAWIKKFPETVNHIYVNDSNSCMGNVGTHILSQQLNYLDSEIFPLLNDKSIPIVDIPLNKKCSKDGAEILKRGEMRVKNDIATRVQQNDLNFPPHVGHTLKCIDIRPPKINSTNRSTCVFMNPKSIIEDLYILENFKKEYEALKLKMILISEKVKKDNEKHPYPIITFLGTGSSIPNKTRNTSGILITFSENNHMIMDCGEGTYGQLVRLFGKETADQILASTKIIYVSHLHADHHLGSINLLQKRRKAVNELNAPLKKVFFLAPQQIMHWLYRYHLNFENILDTFELISNQSLSSGISSRSDYEEALKSLNLKEIRTVLVKHCPFAYGISVLDSEGHRITYSGDCAPSENLVSIGKDSDLLIHEATFEDDLVAEAKIKMHSTTSQAVEIGKKMNAKFTLLTHFSQRYYKIPMINEDFEEDVGIAFDNMRVRLGDLKKLPLFNSILKIMFPDEQEMLEHRSLKRKRKYEI